MLKTGCWSLIAAPGNSWTKKSPRLRSEQGVELPGAIQCVQIVEATDVRIADVDLGNGAPAGPLHHFVAPRRIEIDADLLDGGDALGLQQHLRPHAIRAHARGVHDDSRH